MKKLMWKIVRETLLKAKYLSFKRQLMKLNEIWIFFSDPSNYEVLKENNNIIVNIKY